MHAHWQQDNELEVPFIKMSSAYTHGAGGRPGMHAFECLQWPHVADGIESEKSKSRAGACGIDDLRVQKVLPELCYRTAQIACRRSLASGVAHVLLQVGVN